MPSELIINSRPYETRVALVENGVVVDLHIERATGRELIGNIYMGKIVRVLPGMQAAFVDIGLERTAFLYVSDVDPGALGLDRDIFSINEEKIDSEPSASSGSSEVVHVIAPQYRIEELLNEGQDIMVQVVKEPMDSKGARISSQISIPGRNLVLMPTVNHIGISRKIVDLEERERLRSIAHEIRHDKEGYIVRTAGEGASIDKLKLEMDFLLKLWANILEKRKKKNSTGLLYKELSISLRSVRDVFTKEVDRLITDSKEEYINIMEFINTFAPKFKYCVEYHDSQQSIFEAFGIEMETSRILQNRIWLKSGGYIIIENTEALTSIDVNTGSYVGKKNLEDTILKTNLEAAREIAYQLRFQNIGGLIVIDFIDMEEEVNREAVYNTLKKELVNDRAQTNVLPMSSLGLIEMTRKRSWTNLKKLLTEPCFYCHGKGTLKSIKTICYEIMRALEKENTFFTEKDTIQVIVNKQIETALRREEQEVVKDLEKRIKKQIAVIANDDFHIEKYEIIV